MTSCTKVTSNFRTRSIYRFLRNLSRLKITCGVWWRAGECGFALIIMKTLIMFFFFLNYCL
ncbi:hypothetical protein ACS0TY_027015 [Phlomoides rotata]